MFIEGFYKSALDSSMMSTVGGALQKTPIGQQATSNVNKYLKKAQNINLLGKPPTPPTTSGVGTAAAKSSMPNLSLRNGKELTLNYKNLTTAATPKGIDAKYDIGKGFGAEASMGRNGERRAGFFFKKEF